MQNTTKAKISTAAGKLLAIAAPITAAATQFPMWIEKGGEATAAGVGLSGSFVAVAVISLVPALKGLKEKMKNPGALVLWAVLFAVIWGLAPIIDELKVITLAGVASNGGAFMLGKLAVFFDNKGTGDGEVIRQFLAAQTPVQEQAAAAAVKVVKTNIKDNIGW